MPGQLKSGPDPSKPLPTATAIFREQSEDLSFENDFSELAARFATESGGGLTPELSADLALEIVLNEIVEQACRLTGATGAAIVLERADAMVCRASSGGTAPQLGAAIDANAGLAGECLRNRRTQWCDDALFDHRADAEASMRVGVRSVVVMPLVRDNEIIGFFELFSSQPFAFGVRDERALEALADRTLDNLHRASLPIESEPAPAPMPELAPREMPQEVQEVFAQSEPSEPITVPTEPPATPIAPIRTAPIRTASKQSDLVVWFLGIAVVAAAVLLGVALGRHLTPGRAEAERVIPPVQASQPAVTPVAQTERIGVAPKPAEAPRRPVASARASNPGEVPPGGLLVFQNGKEVFRMPPTDHPENTADNRDPIQLASDTHSGRVLQVPEEAALKELLDRVEPEYPESAREQSIQGQVVLDVHIGTQGSVQGVRVVSGPPILAEVSTEAVKLWKFRPRMANGHPVEMQTRVTLNFRLDQ